MSWALEEWKEGLPWRALQKVQELEGQLDKLKKERQQRQFQLESLEAALQKQKQKVESEKSEGASLKRENQSLVEACEGLERAKQKVAHELQLKEAQLSFQEGQLSTSKKQIERLEQELKRCRAELEKKQATTPSADLAPSNQAATPQKGCPAPVTPSHCSGGSKYEELKEKYNKEVEERRRLEAEVKAWQAKRASPPAPQNTRTLRDIARHQASSSVFWQQDWTPSRLCSGAQRTPRRREVSAGEQEGTPSRLQSGQRDPGSSCGERSSGSHLLDQLRAQNQELRSQAGELQLRLQVQEKEGKSQGSRIQELQLQRDRARAELAEREKALGKSQDELARANAQHEQVAAKCSELEQKLKKLAEDLSCQRQNAESARCSWEQRSKEREKELQEELCRQQRALQGLEQECAKTQGRLSQELQQAKHAHNALQAELDQVTSVKLQLEKNLEESKRKLCRAEQAAQASELKESELRSQSEELRKEVGALRAQSQQSAARVRHLEEELGKATQSCSQRQSLVEELRAKVETQEPLLRELREQLRQREDATAGLEQQREGAQGLLREREQHIERLSEQLGRVQQESEGRLRALEAQEREREQVAAERAALAAWKSEKEPELQQLDAERAALQDQVSRLEASLRAQELESRESGERMRALELDRENLQAEVRGLRGALDSRSAEAEAQQQASEEARQEAEAVVRKLREEAENQRSEAARLCGQVADLERQLGALASEVRAKDQGYQDLLADHESLQAQLRAKDAAGVPDRSLPASAQPAVPCSSFADSSGGGSPPPSDTGHCPAPAALSHPDFASLQNRVTWLESALECQKQESSGLQRRCEELVQARGRVEETLVQAQRQHQTLMAETSQRLRELQEDALARQVAAAGMEAALESKEKELQLLGEALKVERAETQELRALSCSLEDALREQQQAADRLSSEKEEISSTLARSEQEMAALARENGSLRDANAALTREKLSLLLESQSCSRRAEEQETRLSELAGQHARERLALLQRCEEAGQALRDLGEKCRAAAEEKAHLESVLSQSRSACRCRQTEPEPLEGGAARGRQADDAELARAEERSERLRLELAARLAELQSRPVSGPGGFKPEVLVLAGAQPLRAACDADPGHPSLEGSPGRALAGEAPVPPLDLEEEDSSLESADGQMELEPGGPLERKGEPRPTLVQPAAGPGSESAAAQEPAASPGGERALLQQALRAALNQLAGLEQVCQGLRLQKWQLLTELGDARAQCMAATSQLAEEVEELVLEARGLNHSPGFHPAEEEGPRAEPNECPMGPPSPKDAGGACDQGLGHDTEVCRHFSELQEHLHGQRCQVSARMAELQCSEDTLKADSPVLRGHLVEEAAVDPGDGSFLSLSSSCVTDSPGLPHVGESFYRDPEPTGEEAAFSCPGGSLSAPGPREDSLPPAAGLEELEARCRELEESLESQGAAKDRAIEELEQLLGAERQRHLSESELWRQRLASVTADMESQLAEERKHTERLALELEAARLQMQSLDLSSRSLLAPELEEALRGSSEGQQPREPEGASQGAEENARPPGSPGMGWEEESPRPPPGGLQLGESSGEAPGGGRAQGPSQPPAPAGPALESAEFLRPEAALQRLQLQLSESAQERAELVRALEERDRTVQGLLRQVQARDDAQLGWRELEKETPSGHWAPETSLGHGAEGDISGPGDSLDVDTDGSCGCSERVLGLEKELEGLRGQRDQAEGRVLAMEADLAHMQAEKLHLTKDNEDKLRLITCLEGQLAAFRAERSCQLGQGEAWCEGDGERDEKEPPGAPEAPAGPADAGQCPSAHCAEMPEGSPEDGGVLAAGPGGPERQVTRALQAALAEKTARLDCAQDELRQLRRGMERLRERIEADEQLRRRTREQLRQSERRGDALQDRVESLERELQLAEEGQELAILDAEQARAEAEALGVQVAELAVLTQQLQEARGRAAEADAQRSSLESLLEESERAKAQLEDETRAAAERAASLRVDLNELGEEVAALCAGQDSLGAAGGRLGEPEPEPGLGLLRESVARLRARLQADQQEQCRVWARLREGEHQVNELQERVASLERELEVATSHREQLAHEAERVREDAATAAAKLEDTEQCLEALREELAGARAEQEALREELAGARAEQEALREELAGARAEQEALREELAGARTEQEALREELAGARTEQEALREELAGARAEQEALREELAGARAEQEALREELAGARAEQEALREELAGARAEQEALREELAGARAEQEALREELAGARAEQEALREELAGARAEQETLREELAGARAEQEALREELAGARAEQEALREELAGARAEQEALREELAGARAEQEALREELAGARAEQEALREELAGARAEQEALREELAGARTEQEALREELAGARAEQEALREELAGARAEQEALSAALREQQERASGLESQLREQEREQARCSSAARVAEEALRARLAELDAEVSGLRQAREAGEARLGAQVAALEGEKAELLRRLEDGERRLAEQEEAACVLREHAQDRQQLAAQLAQAEAQQQRWAEQEAEQAGRLQALQDAVDARQKALGDLQKELEAAREDNVALEEQVSTLVAKDTELQKERQEREEKLRGEKEQLAQELRATAQEARSCQGQVEALSLENQELRASLDQAIAKQLDEAGQAREEMAQHQQRLLDAEQQHELDMQTCLEKLASREEQLSAQTAELQRLRGSEEALRQTLEATTNNLQELEKKAQLDQRRRSEQLKQEGARAQGKMKLLIKACKQLEEEKEALQKELARLEAAQETQAAGAVTGESLEALQAEVQELREALEEKGREADEYLDKYCALLIGHEKLEKAKEMLETQVARLRAQPARQPPSPAPSPSGLGQPDKGPGKRPRGSGTASPASPAVFPKKRRRTPPSALGPCGEPEDPEYEPEGLPEVVRKGFADIPSGKTSPYVLRRTTMATRTSPRLAAQRAALSLPSLGKENVAGTPKASTGGSRPHKAKVAQPSPAEPSMDTLTTLACRSPLERTSAGSPQEGLRARRSRLAPSPGAPVEPPRGENCRVQ
ncbi:centromere protein F [Sorex araneus]|uniref:centromere protein F n=1 Tax=Sorex araneus TaxID=42254 RepID=UPI0024338C86|nr:centromere protein F [Sorex araneus]